MRLKFCSRLASLTVATVVLSILHAAPALSATIPVTAVRGSAAATDPFTDLEPIVSSAVPMLGVVVPSGYTDVPAVPESEGDVQQRTLEIETDSERDNAEVARVDLNSDIAVLGVTWESSTDAPGRVEARSLIAGEWTQWQTLDLAEGADETNTAATEPMSVTNVEAVEVIAFRGAAAAIGVLTLHVIDPTGSEPLQNSLGPVAGTAQVATETPVYAGAVAGSNTQDTGPIFGLQINTRRAWGADESIRQDWDRPRDGEVTYRSAVVHHTAHGGPNTYTREQVPGLIRSFYYYHAVTLGWGDIGYQLLVDRFGQVWEGRSGSLQRTLLGAHAKGGNLQTFGIAVIGTWTDEAPPAEAMDATARAIGWMFDKYHISDPQGSIWVPGSDGLGRIVPTISGHREVSITACPGDAFFSRLAELRDSVSKLIARPTTSGITRNAGITRFDTAADISLKTYPDGADLVYIANGTNYPDGLAAGPAAGKDGAPLLLVERDSVPAVTLDELKRLEPRSIVLMGGPAVVSPAVEDQLRGLVGSVTRYGGYDLYETAALLGIAKHPSPDTVVIASGAGFPDALSAVAVAGEHDAPLLLTGVSTLPQVTELALREMQPTKVMILGGTAVVSSVVQRVVEQATGATVIRLAGYDRYETSAFAMLSTFPSGTQTMYVANGESFPDALAGGAAAVHGGVPLLLATSEGLLLSTQYALADLRPQQIVILGGPAMISSWNERRLDRFIAQ